MLCPYCGASLPDGAHFCDSCGHPLPEVQTYHHWLHISAAEAADGVQKQVSLPNGVVPVLLSLPAGSVSGATLFYSDFQVYRNDTILSIPLQIHILVDNAPPVKHKTSATPKIAGILLFFLIMGIVAWINHSNGSKSPPPVISAAQAQAAAQEQIPHFDKRVYLQQLSPKLLANFTELYEDITAFEPVCTMLYPMTDDDITALTMLLYLECPELLQLDFSDEEIYSYTMDPDGYASIRFFYCMDKDEYTTAYAECYGIVQQLCREMQGKTDYEKELYAYDYIATACRYSMDAKLAGSAYGALVLQRAKCDGISLAMKWVMEEAGVSCLCITGREADEEIGHAWNIISIDGNYYDLDLTADVTNEDTPMIMHCAVNVSSDFLRKTLIPDELFSTYVTAPGTQSMAQSYHALNGTYIESGDDVDARIITLLDEAYTAGESLCIQFEVYLDYRVFLNNSVDTLNQWAMRHDLAYENWDGWYSDEYRTVCFTFS